MHVPRTTFLQLRPSPPDDSALYESICNYFLTRNRVCLIIIIIHYATPINLVTFSSLASLVSGLSLGWGVEESGRPGSGKHGLHRADWPRGRQVVARVIAPLNVGEAAKPDGGCGCCTQAQIKCQRQLPHFFL